MSETVAITGAFSYTGKYATRILLERGYAVRTLTFHPERPNPFGGQVSVFPYSFERPEELRRSLAGVSTLINTYWVRFPPNGMTFEAAVNNSRTLITAARVAGVRRIVHVSIANPSLESRLGYYHGKALVEQAVRKSGMSYSIVRPTVIFGPEDILINNIAWFVRRFPAFGIPGSGEYGVRPIYVEDMARLLADEARAEGDRVLNAVGPETFSFEEMVRLIAQRVGRSIPLVHVPKFAAYAATAIAGWFVSDVILTWEEYAGLMDDLLAPGGDPTGTTRLSEWLGKNSGSVGKQYASEVGRHFR